MRMSFFTPGVEVILHASVTESKLNYFDLCQAIDSMRILAVW